MPDMTAEAAPPRWTPSRDEDAALVAGRGRFLDDLDPLPGTLVAAVVRSTRPHARLTSVDLSRAEATRRRLAAGGLPEPRFERIEGVADREPIIANDPSDPRNRRVAITLLYRKGVFGT